MPSADGAHTRFDDPYVYVAIVLLGGVAGAFTLLAVSPVTGPLDTLLVVGVPLLTIAVLTMAYRAWMRGLDAMHAAGAADAEAVDAFVDTLTTEHAEALVRAAIEADLLIAQPAQTGHTPKLPYGFPDDVNSFFKQYHAVFDGTGTLEVSKDAATSPGPKPGDVPIGHLDDELLIVRPSTHELINTVGYEGETIEEHPVRSVWHWLLARGVALGAFRHDLRNCLRSLSIPPPADAHAPADPAPLTAADRLERNRDR